ncbi:MAG TPA: prolipoprotein diacylglyceryl transferase [Gemmatimonadaceae bacterium]|nr:prolipoprotein diacylglyceryl transferase [Gemmatimonadaceae bacterium]
MIIHHPFIIHFGPLTLTGFGLAVLFAFGIAQVISQRELARRGEDPTPISDLILAAVIGGLLGAKIYYVILKGDIHAFLSRGGFVFWGGLVGGILAVIFTIRYKKLDMWKIADPAGMAVAAAYAIGRTGCWAVGDDYGRPWQGFLAVQFPDGAPPSTALNLQSEFGVQIPPGVSPDTVLSVYPTQLFEVAMGVTMFIILWRMRDHRHAPGWLFGVYMVLAGIERFLIEFLRAKDDRFLGILTVAQLLALLFIAGGFLWMWMRRGPTMASPAHAGQALDARTSAPPPRRV